MVKSILGTCEYDGIAFDVNAVPFSLFKEMLKAEKSGDPEERADVTLKVVCECIRPSDGSSYDFGNCPWNHIVELSKLTMARAEGAGNAFTIKPVK